MSDGMLGAPRSPRPPAIAELIADGRTLLDLSPRQRDAYDDAVRFAAEIDARERNHYKQLPAQIAAENAKVVDQLNAGRLYLANDTGDLTKTVHFASCPSVRHQIDRDVAHAREIAREGEIDGAWHIGSGNDYVAKWPNLLTLEEVEQLRAYRACQRCNPDTAQRQKRPVNVLRPSKITSINVDRIGREYETVAGEYLGALESFTVSKDQIVLHCSERDYRGTRESLIVLLPAARDSD